MGLHRSSVNFRKLIEDLAGMYEADVTEVVITELVANALDAKATRIGVTYDPKKKILVVEDNGNGMTRSQFKEYHDFAAELKLKGSGIGFAGLGAKISFNVADRVVTQTCGKSFTGGSDWYLKSSNELVWEDIKKPKSRGTGTRVEVHFRKSTEVAYRSRDEIVDILFRNYLPLFDRRFLEFYATIGIYSESLRFTVNGKIIEPINVAEQFGLDKLEEFIPKSGRKRIGYCLFGISESPYPLGNGLCGVHVCTYGKVVQSDFLGQFPGDLGPRIFGLADIPPLAKFLDTSKTKFKKGRQHHREFERLYGPIRTRFEEWLKNVGVSVIEEEEVNEARKLEREIRRLIDEVPELQEFFGFRQRKDVLAESSKGTTLADEVEGAEITFPDGEGTAGTGEGPTDLGDGPGTALVESDSGGQKKAKPISRKAKAGPRIAFLKAEDKIEMAWVDGNNVIINSAHPSYRKTKGNNSQRRLYCLFAIATAIERYFSIDSAETAQFLVDRMMAAWGKK